MPNSQGKSFYELLEAQAGLMGDAPALKGLGAPDLSYAGLFRQIGLLATALNGCGIARGDRVLIQIPNGPESYVVLNAVSAVATAIPISESAGSTEIEHFVHFTEPKAIVVLQGHESSARSFAQQQGVQIIELVPTPEAGAGSVVVAGTEPDGHISPVLAGLDDYALMTHTSGTTALPKMIARTHATSVETRSFIVNLWAMLRANEPVMVLNILPLELLFGEELATAAITTGGSVACMPSFDPDRYFTWLDTYRPNVLAAPPPILEQILARAEQNADAVRRHRIRFIATSSSPLHEAVWTALERTFHAPLLQFYGLSEIGSIAYTIPGTPATRREGSVGRVTDPSNTRVVAEDGTPLPVGDTGEIVYKPKTFTGYWNNTEANQQAFYGDWFRTGDEGTIDADGYLYVTGRLKEVINSGGAKVSPYEVEEVLRQHPDVVDAAAFGIPHAELGEVVAAAVVGTASEKTLRRFAAERLPFHKVPTRIFVVDEIPRTSSGKIQRNRIAEWLGLK